MDRMALPYCNNSVTQWMVVVRICHAGAWNPAMRERFLLPFIDIYWLAILVHLQLKCWLYMIKIIPPYGGATGRKCDAAGLLLRNVKAVPYSLIPNSIRLCPILTSIPSPCFWCYPFINYPDRLKLHLFQYCRFQWRQFVSVLHGRKFQISSIACVKYTSRFESCRARLFY